MRLTDTIIENFLAIGEAQFRLDRLGLVHISGENKDETSADSNGSGKSSVGDAVNWCLWGTTARGVGGDDVVNTAAGKNCKVQTTIDDDGDLWRVTRYRKYAKHKNALTLEHYDPATGAWKDETKGTTPLTQNAVERLLGCSEDVFNAAVYSGQENIPDIPLMTDRQLKVLVEQAAGVDVLTTAYDIARSKLRDRAETRSNAQVAFDRAHQRHQDSLASLTRVSDQSTQWETTQQSKIAELARKTTTAITEFKDAEKAYDVDGETKVKAGITECEAKIAAVSAERQREQLLDGELKTAQNALNQANTRVSLEERSAQTCAQHVREAQEKVEKVKKAIGAPCVSCKRPLEGDHLKAAISAAEKDVEENKTRLDEATKRLADAKTKVPLAEKLVQGANKALTDHRATMTDVSAEGDRLRALQRELHLLTNQRAEIERLKTTARNTGELWKREKEAENPYLDMIEQANKDILDRAAAMKKAEEDRDLALEEEKYAQAVADVYAPAGVRAHRLDEATPFLNERTAHYLGSLADGAIDAFWTTMSETKSKDKLVEKFSVTVEKAGSAPSFKALSGGEKRKVRLACALALQDLVASRAAKNIELWIGDEVDDALDAAGLERLMGVLEEKARERGTVLIISHNDIAHYARRQMLVEKSNGRAKVTVS